MAERLCWNKMTWLLKGFLKNCGPAIGEKMIQPIYPDREELLALAAAKMPYGKFKGISLVDLPEPYLVWFSQRGFPKGRLGEMLQAVYEIKLNGLEYLFKSRFLSTDE